MGTASDQIKTEIDQTREQLSNDFDQLADRTSPRRIAQRRVERARGAFRSARERVMGTAEDASYQVRSRTGEAAGKVQDAAQQGVEMVKTAPDQAMRQTQGNPIAAGLIAFGAGALAATLIPTSRTEEQLADQAQGMVEPVKEAVAESARHLTDEAKTAAKEGGQQVADTAKEATRTTGGEVRDQARSTAEQLRGNEPQR